jgi:hypothetical protein
MVHVAIRTAVAAAMTICFARPAAAEPAPFMMRATISGRAVEGQPLAWNDSQMLLLGRDGALYNFHPDDARDARRLGPRYEAYASEEMQALLRAEFDRGFEISTTAHFIVVHPRGQWREWAERLESLYRSFTHYMSVRGFRLGTPQGPLTAVVFRNEDDYFRHAAAGGLQLAEGTLGHYDPTSNRIYLFDVSESDGDADWSANAETIIHEATHQAAYNVGVHERFSEQPRWAVEGLAMMFEAPGVWAAASHQQQADRLNRYRLDYFRESAKQRRPDWLVRLVASDQPFMSDALSAYAEAWTLSFYLCETRPQEYSAYLERAADRPLFTPYSPTERVNDFIAVFGPDLDLLRAQLERFVETLP